MVVLKALSVICCVAFFMGVSRAAVVASPSPTFGIIDWFPFGWEHEGSPQGMFIDVANAIDQLLAIRSNKIITPVPRVLMAAKLGEIDFTITYRDKVMLRSVDYLVDIGCLKSAIVSMKNKPIKSLMELAGKRVAYPGGGYFVQRYGEDLRVRGIEVARTDIMFRMAERNRLDAFVINDAVWQGYKNNRNPSYIVPDGLWAKLAPPLYLETLPLAVSAANNTPFTALAHKIKGLKKNRAFREALSKIYVKYDLPQALACLPG